jgi:hypothetical protein
MDRVAMKHPLGLHLISNNITVDPTAPKAKTKSFCHEQPILPSHVSLETEVAA